MYVADERKRLISGPGPGDKPTGLGLVFIDVEVVGDPDIVINHAKEVLLAVAMQSGSGWPTVEEWSALLPAWFVAGCRAEGSPEEERLWLEWWRGLDRDAQWCASSERGWSLADWLSWLEPSERQWYWWDTSHDGPTGCSIRVLVVDWPTPYGALEWLVKVAGATGISERY